MCRTRSSLQCWNQLYDLSRLFTVEELQAHGDGQVSRVLDEQFKMLKQPVTCGFNGGVPSISSVRF